MKIYEAFDIDLTRHELVSFIGGGGKTTSIFKIANELKNLEKRVLITTSTAMYNPPRTMGKLILTGNKEYSIDILEQIKSNIILLGKEINVKNKFIGIDLESINQIFKKRIFDYILVEADGSRRKPIKAPAEHEPCIPNDTTITVGVVGMDCIYNKLNDEKVHRLDYLTSITESKKNEIINENLIYKLAIHKQGLFKNTPSNSKKILLLNKADDEKRKKAAFIVKDLIKNNSDIDKIIVASMKKEIIYSI